ncbi:MAG TPA: hypothetical protein VN602_12815, partial [Gemmatimonadaceae bacterium]|nr:hypothetical protein [Gemmatimonadaceae bacterium]
MTILAFIIAATLSPQQYQREIRHDSLLAESVILEVRIGTVASAVVVARRIGDVALLPVAPVLALAELRKADAFNEYLPVDSLAVMLHAPILVDWDDLTATIVDDGGLPASRRAARERRRAVLDTARQDPDALHATTLSTPLLPSTMIVDYDATTSSMSAIAQSTMHLGIGTNFFRGALDVDVLSPVNRRPAIVAWHWDRELAGTLLRYARVGRVPLGDGSAIGDGIFLSSQPLMHDDTPSVTITGATGPGWDVEAYRDGMLVYSGRTDSTGSYAISMPTTRGSNRLTVSAYGTMGEERSLTRYVSVADNALPARTAAYDFAIARCEITACNYAAESTLRYAPFMRVTTGAGLRLSTGSRRTMIEPSLLLTTRLRDDLNASFRYATASTNADLRYAPSPMFDAFVTYANRRLASVSALFPVRYSNATASAIWRITGAGYAASATLAVAGYGLTDTQRLRLFMSLPLGSLYLRPFIDVARQLNGASTSSGRGLFAESPIPFLFPIGSRIRSGFATGGAGDNYITISAPIARSGRLDVGVEWPASPAAPRLTVSLDMLTRAARYETRSTAGSNGSTVHSLSGSLVLASSARLAALSPTQLRGRASIGGVLFLDENGNGIRDATEPTLPGISISAGDVQIETDSVGAYRIDDVIPYTAITLRVDSLGLPTPGMAVPAVRVTPLPNGVTRVDLPITSRWSRLLSGSCGGVGGFPQDAQRRDPPPIHGDHLEPGIRDPNPVSHAREPPQTREYISAERGPVSLG